MFWCKLDETNRPHSVSNYHEDETQGWIPFDIDNDMDAFDYKYIDGEWVYDPVVTEQDDSPSIFDVLQSNISDVELTADMAYINSQIALALLEEV